MGREGSFKIEKGAVVVVIPSPAVGGLWGCSCTVREAIGDSLLRVVRMSNVRQTDHAVPLRSVVFHQKENGISTVQGQ